MSLVLLTQELVNKIQEASLGVQSSYSVIESTGGNQKYQLAMEFLNNAELNIIQAKEFYETYELYESRFDELFEAYSRYKLELFDVVAEFDTNITWLTTRKEQYDKALKNVNEFLEQLNESYN